MIFAPIAMKLDLQKELNEQLNIEDVFSFNIGSFKVTFDEATVVSWIIIAVLTILAILLTRNFKVEGEISRRQAFMELCYEKAENFFKGLMGPKVEKYIPWLMSVTLFIGVSNIIGLFGFKPPTKSMQVTAALAVTSIVLIEYAAFKNKGIGGRLKAFTKPVWVITPISILEVFTKPLSLCMRLFGNVIAAFTIMELIKAIPLLKVGVPVVLSLYFDIFDGLLQAYIFVFLTALYLQESVEEEEEEPKKEKVKKSRKAKKQSA